MGINIGAFACNFVAAYLRNEYGWGYAFAAAGIGMFTGLAIFLFGQNRIREADVLKPRNPEDMPMSQVLLKVFLPAILFAALGFVLPPLLNMDYILISNTTDAFLFACIPVTFFYLRTYTKASQEDKKPVGSLLYIFAVVVVFWMIFHQNGNVLTAWSEDYTKREMPQSLVSAFDPLGFVQKVPSDTGYVTVKDDKGNAITGASAAEMAGPLPAEEDMPSFTPFRVVTGDTLREANVGNYLYNLPHDQWPAKGENMNLMNTELFQSLNPGFVVLFTLFLVIPFFNFLSRRNREPSTPSKIAWGLLITGLSTCVMILAVTVSENGAHKVSSWWLVGTYAVITVGELFLSPMGLSLVSKLAPARLGALMMGGWFLSTSVGNKLAGVLGSLNTAFDDKRIIFFINLAGALVCALLLFAAVKKIRQVVKDKTGHF
jgi:POT family proton-dependent oligopeptide transporter